MVKQSQQGDNNMKNDLVYIKRYARLKTDIIKDSIKLYHYISLCSREILNGKNFTEVSAPIIGPVTDPGIRGAKRVHFSYYGHDYKIMSSMILYKQAYTLAYERIYAFSPNIRLENISARETGRHLCEFYQLDLEVKKATIEDVMDIFENYFVNLLKQLFTYCGEIFEKNERNLKIPTRPFKRISYDEAVKQAERLGLEIEYGEELPWEVEKYLSSRCKDPFWIVRYPIGSRGFYYRIDPKDEKYLLSMDLMYPEGYGEASSGGEREIDPTKIIQMLEASGEEVKEYRWYLDMLSSYDVSSSGLGIGIERLIRYLLGKERIDEVVPFPKLPGVFCI